MRVIIKYLSGIIFLVFLSYMVNAQSIILEELSPQLRNQRLEALRIKRMEAEWERAAVIKEAERLGMPTRIMGDSGKVMELQGFKNGIPLYYTAYNSVAAQTISTNKVFPGGGAGFSLTGNGEILGVWDEAAVLNTHEQLNGRVSQGDSPASFSNHATHVAGTMIGSGFNNASAKGMSYQGSLVAYDWNSDLLEMEAEALNGMRVSNHSYGYIRGWIYNGGLWYWYGNQVVNATQDYLYGFYDEQAVEWDNLANTYPNYLIVKAAGNDRGNGPAPGTLHAVFDHTLNAWVYSTVNREINGGSLGYDCIAHSGLSKNILTVGAVQDIPAGYSNPSDVVLASFSGFGPTDDGRIKPDLVANGIGLTSSIATSNTSYASSNGTSMASPNISGSIGLLNQHQRNLYGGYAFRSSTMKALLIHTADEAGSNPGPDYQFGWGLMNTEEAAKLMSQDAQDCINIKELLLTNGQQIVLEVKKNSAEDLKVTIAWNDPAATPPAPSLNPTTSMLINNVDLRVSSSGTDYLPYVLGGRSNPTLAAAPGDNNVDNVEQVFISNADDGIYRITISHKGILSGSQVVSLVVSGNDAISQDLVLNAPTINYTTAYWAHNSITAQANFNITSTGKVDFLAGGVIDLNPGFRSDLGSNLQARINGRLGCVSGNFMRKAYDNTEHTSRWTDYSSGGVYTGITANPNPVQDRTMFKYQLTNSGTNASIELVNLLGEVVDRLDLGEQSAGWYEHNYNASHLPNGLYLYYLKAGNEIYSGKFIKD